ncbi:DUF262 domain-containing protein [Raoultella planticola]|uniref:DUF262 domain-containing protein n=1 Tax=Raoultella planticola TaxID=575 RepID=UPI0039820899
MTNLKKIVQKFEASQNALVLQTSDLSLQTIAQMVDSGAIDVSPKYQRRERWSPQAQSELMESFLINVPIPPVYLSEDDFGTYSVIDGKQRITTIYGFLFDQFALNGLKKFPEVDGLKFSGLPPELANALKIRPYLRVVTLLKQTDPELKYEVFTRLNTGGEPLLPQEIRNALYRGPFNDLLFELGETPFLLQQLKIVKKTETSYKEMQDVEVVLRFFSLSSNWESFDGNMRQSLDTFAAANCGINKQKVVTAKMKFETALARCETLWGGDAFKRYQGSAYRDQFMSAMFDAQMISASELDDARYDELTHKVATVRKETLKLFTDERFVDAIRVSTNTPSKIRYRIAEVKNILKNVR